MLKPVCREGQKTLIYTHLDVFIQIYIYFKENGNYNIGGKKNGY